MLQQKLGFTERTAHEGKSRRTRRMKVKLSLAPPDARIQRPSYVNFNLKQRAVDAGQIQKVKDETGLDYRLQVDLADCRLDADVAKLLFYTFRVVEMTKDQGTIGHSCTYLELVKEYLPKPSSPEGENILDTPTVLRHTWMHGSG
jgi:hypothetical protein